MDHTHRRKTAQGGSGRFRRRLGALAAVSALTVAPLLLAEPAFAAPQISLAAVTTGVAPFDSAPGGPGLDTSPTDAVIRTNDTIVYSAQVLFDVPVTAAVITFTEASGHGHWTQIPLQCPGAGSSITANGTVLTCDLGNQAGGQTFSLAPDLKVDGSAPNGTVISVTAVLSGSGATIATSTPATTTVSAAPRWDIRKDFGFPQTTGLVLGGVPGYQVDWPILITGPANAKGSELLAGSTITFTDDLTTLYPPPYQGTGSPQLLSAGPNGANGILLVNTPGGTGAGATNAANSGSWSCAQTGYLVNCTVTGADLTLAHVPSQAANGSTLPAGMAVAVSAYIRLFIPKADLDRYAQGTYATITNTVNAFSPVSITGQSVIDDLSNNSSSINLANFATGSALKGYGNTLDLTDYHAQIPPEASNFKAGNGIITPGQEFSTLVVFANGSPGPIANLILCDAIDNQVNIVNGRQRIEINDSSLLGPYRFEYAAGPAYTDPFNQASADCSDGAGPWFSSPSLVPGGAADVTKARIVIDTLGVNGYVVGYFGLVARTDLANGTVLRNMGIMSSPFFQSDMRSSGPTTGDDALSDRILAVRSLVRIDKSTMAPGDDPANPSDSIDRVLSGGRVQFDLRPTFTNPGTVSVTAPVTIVDTLPDGLSYVPGQASLEPTTVTVNGDGTTTLEWDLGTRTPGVPIAPITYFASVDVLAPDGAQLVNTVTVSSPADASPVATRTDTRGVTVQNAQGFGVDKSTQIPTIWTQGDLTYALTVGNSSANPVTGIDLIDVLPFNGDTRPTPSSFGGTIQIASVTPSSPTATVTYTSAASATISSNPRDPSNALGGTTSWCAAGAFGTPGCPASMAAVTAFRVFDPAGLTPGQQLVTDLVVSTDGNAGGDHYSNTFEAVAAELQFTVPSPEVVHNVVEPVIDIAKSVCRSTVLADCDVDDPADWLPTVEVSPGSDAVWRIQVSNPGAVDLDGVVVTDAFASTCDKTYATTLAAGASFPAYSCVSTGISKVETNIAVVDAAGTHPIAGPGPAVGAAAQAGVTVPVSPQEPEPTPTPNPPGDGSGGGTGSGSGSATGDDGLATTGMSAAWTALLGAAAVLIAIGAGIASRRGSAR